MTSLRILSLLTLLTHQSVSLEDTVTVSNASVACCPGPLFVGVNNHWCRNKTAWVPLSLHCPFGNFSTRLGDEIIHNGTHMIRGMQVYDGQYCVGKLKSGPIAVICIEESVDTGLLRGLKYVLGILSLIGAILTAITYGTVKEIRDVLGKSVISLCIALVIGVGAINVLAAPKTMELHECAVIAFTAQVFMLAAFFWMNTIAIQVYRMFDSKQPSDRAFIWYSLYAWGSATLILIITLIVNFTPDNSYSPEIGISACWFNEKWSQGLFLIGPIAVLMLTNLCLIVAVGIKFHFLYDAIKSNRKKLLRYKIILFVRMIVVMGIFWIADIIFILNQEQYWLSYVSEFINLLQGAFIFIVLVLLRPKAMQGLAKRGLLLCFNEMVLQRIKYTDCPETAAETVDGTV